MLIKLLFCCEHRSHMQTFSFPASPSLCVVVSKTLLSLQLWKTWRISATNTRIDKSEKNGLRCVQVSHGNVFIPIWDIRSRIKEVSVASPRFARVFISFLLPVCHRRAEDDKKREGKGKFINTIFHRIISFHSCMCHSVILMKRREENIQFLLVLVRRRRFPLLFGGDIISCHAMKWNIRLWAEVSSFFFLRSPSDSYPLSFLFRTLAVPQETRLCI